jgi:hypothetical protein
VLDKKQFLYIFCFLLRVQFFKLNHFITIAFSKIQIRYKLDIELHNEILSIQKMCGEAGRGFLSITNVGGLLQISP